MANERLGDFVDLLQASGIPIHGVSGEGLSARIDFKSAATAQQRIDAIAMRDSFDWTPRRQKGIAALSTEINALSAQDQRKLLLAVQADFLRKNPRFARRLNINLDGDEPAA